jgi:uncharacterized protein YbcI
MADRDELQTTEVEKTLAGDLLRLHAESYGKGASEARVYVLEDVVFCVLDGVELLPNEQFLVDTGHGEAVTEIRHRFQLAIETSFRAAVERSTGRRVVSFLSNTGLEPNYTVEIFRLGPRVESRLTEPQERERT